MTQDQVNKAFAQQEDIEYPEDCLRIVTVVGNYFGVRISDFEAHTFWRWRSNNMAAGWLIIQDDDEIISNFRYFVTQMTGEDESQIENDDQYD